MNVNTRKARKPKASSLWEAALDCVIPRVYTQSRPDMRETKLPDGSSAYNVWVGNTEFAAANQTDALKIWGLLNTAMETAIDVTIHERS